MKWAFATTVLGILWPFEPAMGGYLRASFAGGAHAMRQILDSRF